MVGILVMLLILLCLILGVYLFGMIFEIGGWLLHLLLPVAILVFLMILYRDSQRVGR